MSNEKTLIDEYNDFQALYIALLVDYNVKIKKIESSEEYYQFFLNDFVGRISMFQNPLASESHNDYIN